jgi:predicted DNA-binding transcriptional regulator AlpA
MATYRPLINPPDDTPSAIARHGPPRIRQSRYPRPIWWTRERMLVALRRFHGAHGMAPTASEDWQRLTLAVGGRDPRTRPYPSFVSILRVWPTLRAAWHAAGVLVDHDHEDWTPIEDWYLREAAGLVLRAEIARDLRRTPQAVKTRLAQLGLHSYQVHGWTLNRLAGATGVSFAVLHRHLMRGLLPFRRGTKCFYVDPADLVEVTQVDWTRVPAELERAARRSLMGRLVTLLEGGRLQSVAERGAAALAAYRAETRPHRRGVPTSIRGRVTTALHARGLLTVREAAPLLGVSTVSLYRWIAREGYPAERVQLGDLSLVGVRLPARVNGSQEETR